MHLLSKLSKDLKNGIEILVSQEQWFLSYRSKQLK